MANWEETYRKNVKKMFDIELFNEYTALANGDDYTTGVFSQHGLVEFTILKEELLRRLKELGFMEDITFYCDDERHLVCVPYSVENLHRMAETLGIARDWYHKGKNENPHYDIPKRRIQEIQEQCVVVSSNEIVDIIRGRFTT